MACVQNGRVREKNRNRQTDKQMTDDEVRKQWHIYSMVWGSVRTVSLCMSFSLMMLGEHPHQSALASYYTTSSPSPRRHHNYVINQQRGTATTASAEAVLETIRRKQRERERERERERQREREGVCVCVCVRVRERE